jgi:hypothetical protein
MSLPDLTGQNIENTYQRLVQTDGTNFYDGTGSIVNLGGETFPYTGSAIISGSLEVIGPFTASGFNYPTIAGNEGEAIVIDQDGNLNFAYPKAVTERVKNVSGVQLLKGTPVHATGSGTSGNIVGVIVADAGDPTKMPATYVLNETLDDEAEGEALAVGYIQGVDTTGLIEGNTVYVAVGGGWTQTKPTGSALIQNLGIVTKVGQNGSGIVLGAGRSNDLPNIQSGYTWVGNSNGVPTAVPTSSLIIDPFPYTGSAIISGSLILTGSFKALLPTSSNDTYFLTYNTASYQLEAREVATLINPKVEYYDVTASISSGTSITLPNGLSYISSSIYEYLEVFFNGLRLRYNRDFIPTSITTIQTQITFPSGSELTFKSLKA